MTNKILNKYISLRYDRWMDYAKYHCEHQGMLDQTVDVLNEVLVMLLEKFDTDQSYIMQLYARKIGEYTELDFYVLQMIKLNIQSPTSPYRYKYRSLTADENVDYQEIEIMDNEDSEIDRAGIILSEMQQVREIVDSLQLSDLARRIFFWKFFEGNRFSEWEGKEDKAYLYDVYNEVLSFIKSKIDGETLF